MLYTAIKIQGLIALAFTISKITWKSVPDRAFFNHLLHAVPARNALFEKEMPFSLLKTPKTHEFFLGGGGRRV